MNQLEAKKEYAARPAEAYLDFVKEFPKSEIADKALYNASDRLLQRASMLDKAIAARER